MSTGYTQMRLSPQQIQRRRKVVDPVQQAFEQGRLAEAHELATAGLKKMPGDAQLHLFLAAIAERTGDVEQVRHHGRKALNQGPNAGAFTVLSRLERRAANTELALELCDRALELVPGDVPLRIHRAGCLEEAGRTDEARAVVDDMVSQLESRNQPLPPHLQFERAKLSVQAGEYDRAIDIIDGLHRAVDTPRELRSAAWHLKAKALDRAGRYAEAFGAATAGNEVDRRPFDPDAYERQTTAIIEMWSKENMATFPESSCDSEVPVFIAGMPRSGTSLLDQIIHAHSKAAGVGELDTLERFFAQVMAAYRPEAPEGKRFGSLNRFKWTRAAEDYVREIRKTAPDDARIANKAIGNTRIAGLLARLFPNTRIIHIRRDPRDVAISCYMGAFNNMAMPWTTRLDWVARAYEQTERLMDHWKRTLDVPFLEVRYEDMVRDPATQLPRIIDFLGLEWDDACREFYKTKRTLRTLSYDQVNRPLYTSSVGRHANYAGQISGVDFPAYP
ncbi:MAG: sulfotransferase [Phycisphaerales bacterium]